MTPRTTATPDAIPRSILSTLLNHCTPAIRGEYDDFRDLLYMYTAPPCVYKRWRRALSSPTHLISSTHSAQLAEHARSPELRYWHLPPSTSPLAETWEFPSLSRLACTPYYRHPRCKIVPCTRTPLCWTYGPVAGTRINRAFLCYLLHQPSRVRDYVAFYKLVPDRRVRTPTRGLLCQLLFGPFITNDYIFFPSSIRLDSAELAL